MTKYILVSLCLIFLCSFYQIGPSNKTIIIWNDSIKLTWNDFKAHPLNNNKNSTISCTSIFIKASNVKILSFDIDIIAYFIKNKSWVVLNQKDELGLKHEQGHFDITEIYARKCRKTIRETEFKKRNVGNLIKNIYNDSFKECNKQQDLYDKETDHSHNTKKQEEWNSKITLELRELENYKTTHLSIKLKNN